MLPKIVIVLTSVFLLTATTAADPDQHELKGYSSAPLKQPIFSAAEVAVRTTRFNNWLNTKAENLEGEQLKQAREHLYYLINSHIKHRVANKQPIVPSEPDLILATLFSWSERLGVYGGYLLHNQLKVPSWEQQTPINTLPGDMALSLRKGLFNLSSKTGNWQVDYPYYFMLQDVREFTNTAGHPTNFLSIATGSAPHSETKGYSQATLVLIFSPEIGLKDFQKYWLRIFAVSNRSTKKITSHQSKKSYYVLDKTSRLHKEIVFWQAPQGSFAVAYMGIDGTYQHNRPHFFDFLASLKTNSR